MNLKKPLAVSQDILVQELPDELLIYKLKTHKAMSLNKTVAAVWQNCNGQNTIPQITESVSRKFKTTVTEEIVLLALETLSQSDLLISQGEAQETTFIPNVSRREVIRRAALSTAVALPVIASLSAPKAARAASNPNLLADGTPCTLDTQCQSGCCTGFCDDPLACQV
jgi:Coenzyme PQQ synthesis protein D (PqqD)